KERRILAAAGTIGKSAPTIARLCFAVYLFSREETRRFGFFSDSWARSADVFRRRLQQPGSRADQTDAAGRSLFCFTHCQGPPAVLGAFRVRQVFRSAFGGLAEFLLRRNLSCFH